MANKNGFSIKLDHITSFCFSLLLAKKIKGLAQEGVIDARSITKKYLMNLFEELKENPEIKGLNKEDLIIKTDIPKALKFDSYFIDIEDYYLEINHNTFINLIEYIEPQFLDIYNIKLPYTYDDTEAYLQSLENNDAKPPIGIKKLKINKNRLASGEDREYAEDLLNKFQEISLQLVIIEFIVKQNQGVTHPKTISGYFKIFTAIIKICCGGGKNITAPFFLYFLSMLVTKDTSIFLERNPDDSITLPVNHGDFEAIFLGIFSFFDGLVIGTVIPDFNKHVFAKPFGDDVLKNNKEFVNKGGVFIRIFLRAFAAKLKKKGYLDINDISKDETEIIKKQLQNGIDVCIAQPLSDISIEEYDFTIFFSPMICVNKMSFDSDKDNEPIESNIYFGIEKAYTEALDKLKRILTDSKNWKFYNVTLDKKTDSMKLIEITDGWAKMEELEKLFKVAREKKTVNV